MNAHRPRAVPCTVHAAFALALGAILLILSPGLAIAQQAEDAYVFLTNPTNVRNPIAQVDVSLDTGATGGQPAPIAFTLFREDGSAWSLPLTVFTDQNGYASSTAATSNLFDISGGGNALLLIQYAGGPYVAAAAVLRKEVKGSQTTIAVAPVWRRDWTLLTASPEFKIAIGDLGDGISLFIANVAPVTAMVDVFHGTRGVQGLGAYFNPNVQPRGFWRLDLQQSDAHQNIVVRSTEPVIVQLVRLSGSKASETMLVPH